MTSNRPQLRKSSPLWWDTVLVAVTFWFLWLLFTNGFTGLLTPFAYIGTAFLSLIGGALIVMFELSYALLGPPDGSTLDVLKRLGCCALIYTICIPLCAVLGARFSREYRENAPHAFWFAPWFVLAPFGCCRMVYLVWSHFNSHSVTTFINIAKLTWLQVFMVYVIGAFLFGLYAWQAVDEGTIGSIRKREESTSSNEPSEGEQ